MSQNFSNKDYGDYFNALERQLNNENRPRKVSTPAKGRAKKSRRYLVFRIRPAVWGVLAIIITVSIILAVALPSGKEENPPLPTASDVEATASEAAETKPDYSFKKDNKTVIVPWENDAVGAIVVSADSRRIIAERESTARLYPASTTKVMTLLVAAENTENFDEKFTMTQKIIDKVYVRDASLAGFLRDEEVSIKDLLYGLILPSGADAAIALAEKISGSEEAFVKLMNEKAEELELKNSNFTNTSGLFDSKHYTCAYDMAVILAEAIKNPICREILATAKYTSAMTPQNPNGVAMTSTLFTYISGNEPENAIILGGKTGFVNQSGYCIASFGRGETSGEEYIIVTFKNSNRKVAMKGQIDLYSKFAK